MHATTLLKFIDLIIKTDFSNTILVTCHHILEIDYRVIKYLIKNGLKPENIFVIGKNYSTNINVLNNYKKLGVYIDEASFKFNQRLSFDKFFEIEIKRFINKIFKKINFNKKIIIWDDGGGIFKYINKIHKAKWNIVGIEQTSSGFNKLKNKKLKFPIVNMARSNAKLEFESPYIAKKNIKNLNLFLKQNKQLVPKNVIIVGAGAIGKSVYKELSKKYFISSFDKKSDLNEFKNRKLVNVLQNFDIIIGATGETIVKFNDFKKLKKNAVLLSVSSSDREFSAQEWRKKINKKIKLHDNLILDNKYLLNNGFPLNFDGNAESVPLRYIQLTGALTLYGIFFANNENNLKKTFVDIPIKEQKKIVCQFLKIIKK